MAVIVERTAGDDAERMAEIFGPGQIDQSIRHAIQFCWMSLPRERRTAEELENQFRRLVERALKDFRDDLVAFGKEDAPREKA